MKFAKVAVKCLSLASVAGVLIATPARAQTAPAAVSAAADDSGAGNLVKMNQFLVTATTSQLTTPLDASFAVSVITAQDMVSTQAPGVAGLLSNVPSLFGESAGGEINQNLSTRGVRGGFFEFMSLQEDGLPTNYNGFFSEWDYRPDETYDRVEVVRGGPSGVFAPNAAAAIVNFISNIPKTQTADLTLSAEIPGDERLDFFVGGPVPNENGWAASIGGHYLIGEGSRPVGFIGEWGGQIRAAVQKTFAAGSITLTYKYIDLHNIDYSPAPAFAVYGGDTQAIPGFDPRKDSLYSTDLLQTTIMQFHGGPAQQDLQDGQHSLMNQLTAEFKTSLGDGWSLSESARVFSSQHTDVDLRNEGGNSSIYQASAFVTTAKSELQSLVPTVSTVQLVRIKDNAVVGNPSALNGNGLLTTMDNSYYNTNYNNVINDTRTTWDTDRNSLTLGWLFMYVPATKIVEAGNDYLIDITNHASRYDVQGLNAAGQVVAHLTDNGVSAFGADYYGNGGLTTTSDSIYLNDEFKVTKAFKIDAGVRLEYINFQLSQEGYTYGAPVPGGAANNWADVQGIGSLGNNRYSTTQSNVHDHAWTVGGNYQITDTFALYARTGHSFDTGVQDFDMFGGSLPMNASALAELEFNEVGFHYDSKHLAASVDAFTGENRNVPVDATTSTGQPVTVTYNNNSKGVELEATWSPNRTFSVDVSGVLQKAEIAGLPGGLGALGIAAGQFNGKQIDRLPDVQAHLQPTYYFPKGSAYVSLDYAGQRYGDLANTLRLNAYELLGAGLSYRPIEKLTLSLSGTNLLNQLAFDVGNPRGGSNISAGTGPIFARALLGEQLKVSGSFKF